MASFKTNQEYEEAKMEWLQVPHAAYIQKSGRCVQMTGFERMIVSDPVAAQIIGTATYNTVGKIENLNQRFRNSQIVHFKEFRHFKCILDIEEKAFENCTALQEIYLPEYVYTIGNHAFSHCTSLENIKLRGWKSHGGLTPWSKEGLTPENNLFLTPYKSWPVGSFLFWRVT